ncbi:MAG: hypothetical protein ABSC77_03660 [Terracidiphilus sp.]|jgi:hypothetical protein
MSDAGLPSQDEKLFKIALDTRNFEISLFWQRSNYFLVLNSALAIGFFSRNDTDYSVVLAILGAGASLLWFLVNLGGKYWQSRWEHELVFREIKIYPDDPVFAASREQTDEFVRKSLLWNNPGIIRRLLNLAIVLKPSVSFMMTILSAVFFFAWMGLLALHTNVQLNLTWTKQEATRSTMGFWGWLDFNSGAVQSIASLFSIALAAITIGVLFITWRAIKRHATAAEAHAEAARALTQVAKDQTAAAFETAKLAQKQVELLSSQIEQSTAPLLVAERDDTMAFPTYDLVNRGPGVAFQIFFWVGKLDLKNSGQQFSIQFIEPSTLGPGSRAHLPMPPQWEVITVRYKGIDRLERWTIIYNDPLMPQEHVMSKGLQEFYLS